jgi:zinc transport system substrate-binding protein
VDLHSFQPTAADILKISTCDLFIYVGGESDEWVDDALREATNKSMTVVSLLDVLGDAVKEEEVVEGMQEEEHEDEHDEDEHGEEEVEYDEHVWLSLKKAQVVVTGIADAMGKADPNNAGTYKTNADNYKNRLAELDSRYADAVANSNKNTVLFGDRFPFRYLTDDYNLNYYAAFAGCSAETEASFDTVIFLSGKIDELGLKKVLVIESSDQKVAQTIIDNTAAKDLEILVLDSMQATSSSDIAKGVTYISVMESNLEVLTKALS